MKEHNYRREFVRQSNNIIATEARRKEFKLNQDAIVLINALIELASEEVSTEGDLQRGLRSLKRKYEKTRRAIPGRYKGMELNSAEVTKATKAAKIPCALCPTQSE